MDWLPANATYFLLLGFGMFAVGVHAYSLYGMPPPSASQTRDIPLLDAVSLSALGGQQSYTAGFLCYLGIIELLYLVLSSSSVILELSLEVVGSDETIGALSRENSTLNPLFPVLAATIITTITELKPFSDIEHVIRRIAHHVAGIPHYLFDIQDRIQSFDFDLDVGEEPSRAVVFSRQLADEAEAAALRAGLDELDSHRLHGTIIRIYSLYAWSAGHDGDLLWSSSNRTVLKPAEASLVPRFQAFDLKLRNLLRDSESAQDDLQRRQYLRDWEAISTEAAELKTDVAMLFSLLVINEPTGSVPADAPMITRLLDHLRGRYKRIERNALSGALLLGFLLNAILVLMFYVLSDTAAEWPRLLATPERADTGAVAPLFGFALERSSLNIGAAVWDVLNWGVLFLVAASVALSIRATRLTSRNWVPWSDRELPFREYATLALLAALFAGLMYLVVNFIALVILPSLSSGNSLVSPVLLRDFHASMNQLLLSPLIAAVCAWYVCYAADREQQGQGVRLGRTASLFAALCAGINLGVVSYAGHLKGIDGFILALLPPACVFFVFFYLFSLLQARMYQASAAS